MYSSDATKKLYEDWVYAKEVLETIQAKLRNATIIENCMEKLYRDSRLDELRSMDYGQYLQTPEWQSTRLRAIENSQGKCERCGAIQIDLQVHHKNYERVGQELQTDLMVLCKECHEKVHGLAVNL
jgi:hypothetical protein